MIIWTAIVMILLVLCLRRRREKMIGSQAMCVMGREMNRCKSPYFRQECREECETFSPFFDYKTGEDIYDHPCSNVGDKTGCYKQYRKNNWSKFCAWGKNNGSCNSKEFYEGCKGTCN